MRPGGWGPGFDPSPWGPVFDGPWSGFVDGLYNVKSSCFNSLCCCWLLQDCFGGPRSPSGPPPPF